MKEKMINVLNKYSMLTYYEEKRDKNGRLLFFKECSFDKVEVDTITKYIVLSNENSSSSICIIDPHFGYKIIPLKYERDKIIILDYSGKNSIIFFGKKN